MAAIVARSKAVRKRPNFLSTQIRRIRQIRGLSFCAKIARLFVNLFARAL
jgi:hypothetical protein